MTKPIPQLDVIFRTPRHGPFKGQVTAYFPSEPGTRDYATCACYAHVGQHGSASWAYYRTERLATSAEYADLLAELRGIYETGADRVKLVVKTRWTARHDKARLAELNRSYKASA